MMTADEMIFEAMVKKAWELSQPTAKPKPPPAPEWVARVLREPDK